MLSSAYGNGPLWSLEMSLRSTASALSFDTQTRHHALKRLACASSDLSAVCLSNAYQEHFKTGARQKHCNHGVFGTFFPSVLSRTQQSLSERFSEI